MNEVGAYDDLVNRIIFAFCLVTGLFSLFCLSLLGFCVSCDCWRAAKRAWKSRSEKENKPCH